MSYNTQEHYNGFFMVWHGRKCRHLVPGDTKSSDTSETEGCHKSQQRGINHAEKVNITLACISKTVASKS